MTLTQYSIVCQVPGDKPYTVCAYSGEDLSQVLGITQALSMPEGSWGWIQECGEAFVRVRDQTQDAYADFRPNTARLHVSKGSRNDSEGRNPESSPGVIDERSLAHRRYERLSRLPPLLIEVGPYCLLLREARDVFVDGYFYACVAMCGISFERFQRDRATSCGATRRHHMGEVRSMLEKNGVLQPEALVLCEKMANLRNDYAHGYGLRPEEDALKAIEWMHCFIDRETNLMRDYVIVDGMLIRKHRETV
ncbi:MAG: hypothetical protein ABFD90_03595 [Phycisphaerales bacterium]